MLALVGSGEYLPKEINPTILPPEREYGAHSRFAVLVSKGKEARVYARPGKS
jgi:hypothetical protein